jgi:hypothetical protein
MGLGQALRWIVIHAFHYREPQGWNPTDFVVMGSLFFASALVAAAIMTRIEKRSFRDYGLPLSRAGMAYRRVRGELRPAFWSL